MILLRRVCRVGAIVGFVWLAGCSAGGTERPVGLNSNPPTLVENLPDLSQPPSGDAWGHAGRGNKVLYLFSQRSVGQQDPQVLEFSDAVLIRGWQRWQREGLAAGDYDFDYPARARARGIDFVAGGTASVVFSDENPALFERWITRDALGESVEHTEILPGAYRATLANPSYREHLIAFAKLQIDGGVDGLFFDEVNGGGFNGGPKWQYNGNEGFDDHFLAAFNAYLLDKHPGFGSSDWVSRYGMSLENQPRKDLPPGDLARNFNYRRYLAERGLARDPMNARNPLLRLWGQIEGNREHLEADNFREKAFDWYWRDIVTQLREYARSRYGKEIQITSNGLFRYVDFNSFGLYPYNADYEGREVDWVPVKAGRLDGTRSYQAEFKALYKRNQQVSGDVPLVLFLDWPTEMMNRYYSLSAAEKMDFWRIYAAEAYANGLFFAFHLRTSKPDEPSASESGILDFLKTYTRFYVDHADLYLKTHPVEAKIELGLPLVSASLTEGQGGKVLHLVNHNYASGLKPQANFGVSLPLSAPPKSVKLHSPDGSSRSLVFQYADGKLSLQVDQLVSYDAIVIDQ